MDVHAVEAVCSKYSKRGGKVLRGGGGKKDKLWLRARGRLGGTGGL